MPTGSSMLRRIGGNANATIRSGTATTVRPIRDFRAAMGRSRRTETTIALDSEPATTRAIATTRANASDFDLAGRRWRRRDFQRRQLHLELDFACGGELPEDVAIDHQPRIFPHAGHALRETP